MLASGKVNPNKPRRNSAGQSGDIQQISDVAEADSESVEELLEEGNAFEADAMGGVENAKDPDVSEVTTRQVPQNVVPAQQLDNEGTLHIHAVRPTQRIRKNPTT